jgi:Mn2+/Fe2+ NRAMP family transporter
LGDYARPSGRVARRAITLLSQVANGIVLPFVLIFMLRLCSREDPMRKDRNVPIFNAIAWIT